MDQRQLTQLDKRKSQLMPDMIAESESILAQNYKTSFNMIKTKLAKLYEALGPKPTIQEANRYNRLLVLADAVKKEYFSLTKQTISLSEKFLTKQFTTGVRANQWYMEGQGNIDVGWGAIPKGAIQDSVFSEISGAVFSDRLKSFAGKTIDRTVQNIRLGLINGLSYSETAAKLQEDYQSGFADAIRVVRTESARNFSEGNLLATEKATSLGIQTRKKWIAVIDDKTREDHAALDGTYADEDGMFQLGGEDYEAPLVPADGSGDPAEIVNCRCTYVDEVVDAPRDLYADRQANDTFPDFQAWREAKGYTD